MKSRHSVFYKIYCGIEIYKQYYINKICINILFYYYFNFRLIYDRETGRAKGFGFCDFADETAANGAITTLNGADFYGRPLRVNWANNH